MEVMFRLQPAKVQREDLGAKRVDRRSVGSYKRCRTLTAVSVAQCLGWEDGDIRAGVNQKELAGVDVPERECTRCRRSGGRRRETVDGTGAGSYWPPAEAFPVLLPFFLMTPFILHDSGHAQLYAFFPCLR